MSIYKLTLSGDMNYTLCVEIHDDYIQNVINAKIPDETWDVCSYRLSKCNKFVEHYSNFGKGIKISENHIAVKLNNSNEIRDEADLLVTTNSLIRRALIFLPKGSKFYNHNFTEENKDNFESQIVPELMKGGLIAFPINLGFSPLTVTCKCKSFFGCTTGCCTNPTCKVVLGICQDNPDCKKVDATSSCTCQED